VVMKKYCSGVVLCKTHHKEQHPSLNI